MLLGHAPGTNVDLRLDCPSSPAAIVARSGSTSHLPRNALIVHLIRRVTDCGASTMAAAVAVLTDDVLRLGERSIGRRAHVYDRDRLSQPVEQRPCPFVERCNGFVRQPHECPRTEQQSHEQDHAARA